MDVRVGPPWPERPAVKRPKGALTIRQDSRIGLAATRERESVEGTSPRSTEANERLRNLNKASRGAQKFPRSRRRRARSREAP